MRQRIPRGRPCSPGAYSIGTFLSCFVDLRLQFRIADFCQLRTVLLGHKSSWHLQIHYFYNREEKDEKEKILFPAINLSILSAYT